MSVAKREVQVEVWTLPTEEEVDAIPLPEMNPEKGVVEVAGEEIAREEEVKPELPVGIDAESTHAFLFAHAEEAAAVLRTIVRRNEGADGPLAGIAGAQLTAVFAIGAGEEVGARVIALLDRDEKHRIAEGIVQMEEVAHHACMHALELVKQRVEEGEYVELGGRAYAFDLLGRMMPSYMVDHMLEEIEHPVEPGFGWMNDLPADRVAPFIAHEHPQTVAMVLSQLESKPAAGILAGLPEAMQRDVAYRMATLNELSPDAIAQIGESMYRALREIAGKNVPAGGFQTVAEMLNETSPSVERNVLQGMDELDAEAAEGVRMWMFTFEDIAILQDGEIRIVVDAIERSEFALALRACSEALRERIKNATKDGGWREIEELLEYAGPVRLREVEAAQVRVVRQVRQLEVEGKITIIRGEAGNQLV